jgi:hypothetical protein
MVPRFRGDDTFDFIDISGNRHILDFHPLAAPTFENRLRMRSSRVSQTSR